MGGGAPVAAFGGREDVMAVLAPEGSTFTGGTHGGNPFCIAMAHRVLDLLEKHPEYYSKWARSRIDWPKAFARFCAVAVCHMRSFSDESVVDFKFRPGPPARTTTMLGEPIREAYAAYYRAMIARGILLPPSQNEVMFLSTAHA